MISILRSTTTQNSSPPWECQRVGWLLLLLVVGQVALHGDAVQGHCAGPLGVARQETRIARPSRAMHWDISALRHTANRLSQTPLPGHAYGAVARCAHGAAMVL